MFRRNPWMLAACSIAVLAGASPSHATWPADPTINVLVSGTTAYEWLPVVATDGLGGMYVAWVDDRDGVLRARVQHVSATGELLWWPPSGVPLTNLVARQDVPRLLADGSGGVIVAWSDRRASPWARLYGQRLSAAGTRLWGVDGALLAQDTLSLEPLALVPNGSGGALIATYGRNALSPYLPELSVLAVNPNGAPAWSASPVRLRSAGVGFGYNAMVSPDGGGGALFAWHDHVDGHLDVFVQRVSDSGAQPWGTAPLRVAPYGTSRFSPSIVADGAGGALVEWHNMGPYHVLAQRLGPDGTRLWDSTGVVLWAQTETAGDTLVADGAGGAYAVHGRYLATVRHLRADGTLDWNGDSLIVNRTSSLLGVMVSAPSPNAGGGPADLLLAWAQQATPALWMPQQIRAQRVTPLGAFAWADTGAVVSSGPGERSVPAIVADGGGGLLAAWSDRRNGVDPDLYAQRVATDGTLRTTGTPPPVTTSFSLSAPAPNPARPGSGTTLLAGLPAGALLRASVLDVSGRLVRVLQDGAPPGRPDGAWRLHWDGLGAGGARVAPGLYFVRVSSGDRTATRRVILTD